MPWKESDAMDQRLQFVTDALSDRFTMTELCERYGVSRRIGYKCRAAVRVPANAPGLGRAQGSKCSGAAIRRSRTGQRRVRPPTSSRGAGWCGTGAGDVSITTRA